MNNNIRTTEKTTEKVNNEVDLRPEVTPPENYDVMLYNDNTVHWYAIRDVLAAVLQTSADRAMKVAEKAHTYGKASVFTGPHDVAVQFKDALMAEAQARNHGPTAMFMGFGRIRFEVEKVRK